MRMPCAPWLMLPQLSAGGKNLDVDESTVKITTMNNGPISVGDPSVDRELEAYAEKRGAETVAYWYYHRVRFHFEARLVSRYLAEFPTGGKIRILDIGPSFQTMMFH